MPPLIGADVLAYDESSLVGTEVDHHVGSALGSHINWNLYEFGWRDYREAGLHVFRQKPFLHKNIHL